MDLLFCSSCVSPAFSGLGEKKKKKKKREKKRGGFLWFGNLNPSVESEFLPAKGILIFLRLFLKFKVDKAPIWGYKPL